MSERTQIAIVRSRSRTNFNTIVGDKRVSNHQVKLAAPDGLSFAGK